MKEVLEYLAKCKTFYFATSDGDQPRVRPFGFAMEYEGRLCLCTGNKKPVFRQMQANPKVELCACAPDGTWLRVSGTAKSVTSDASQKRALEIAPMLSQMYSVGDGVFEIFTVDNATAVFSSFGGEDRVVKL